MKIETKLKQHEKLLAELIQLNETSSRRLRIMEKIQAIVIPVYLIFGVGSVLAFLKIFGFF